MADSRSTGRKPFYVLRSSDWCARDGTVASIDPATTFGLQTPLTQSLLSSTRYPISNVLTDAPGEVSVISGQSDVGIRWVDICIKLSVNHTMPAGSDQSVILALVNCNAPLVTALTNTDAATGAPSAVSFGGPVGPAFGTDNTWQLLSSTHDYATPWSSADDLDRYQSFFIRRTGTTSQAVRYIWLRFAGSVWCDYLYLGKVLFGTSSRYVVDGSLGGVGVRPRPNEGHEYNNWIHRSAFGQSWSSLRNHQWRYSLEFAQQDVYGLQVLEGIYHGSDGGNEFVFVGPDITPVGSPPAGYTGSTNPATGQVVATTNIGAYQRCLYGRVSGPLDISEIGHAFDTAHKERLVSTSLEIIAEPSTRVYV